jgi:hypothetical protein
MRKFKDHDSVGRNCVKVMISCFAKKKAHDFIQRKDSGTTLAAVDVVAQAQPVSRGGAKGLRTTSGVRRAEDGNAMAQTGRLDVEAVPEWRPPVACLDPSSPRRCGTTSSTPRMGPAGLGPRQPPTQHRLR